MLTAESQRRRGIKNSMSLRLRASAVKIANSTALIAESRLPNHDCRLTSHKKCSMKPLQDIIVVDFSQFLSGPSAGLRLADMGAQVIKIERPGSGDICRQLYVSDTRIEGESTIFHAINRNKQSYAADLKNSKDLEKIKKLIRHADVVLHNFRPGVMERIGLDYETVRGLNPRI